MPTGLIGLIEPKTLAILTTFVSNQKKIHHLNSLAKESKVPVSSTKRILKRLVKNQFVEEVPVGKLILYKCASSKKIKNIKKLL